MSFGTARNAINAAFDTAWADQTPVEWPNVEFTKPNPKSAWVRITVDGNLAGQAGFGDGVLHRNSGLIFVQVFIPDNDGPADADTYAQSAANALQYKRIDHISGGRPLRTWGATQRTVGNQDGWYQVNVTIPFDYDEVI